MPTWLWKERGVPDLPVCRSGPSGLSREGGIGVSLEDTGAPKDSIPRAVSPKPAPPCPLEGPQTLRHPGGTSLTGHSRAARVHTPAGLSHHLPLPGTSHAKPTSCACLPAQPDVPGPGSAHIPPYGPGQLQPHTPPSSPSQVSLSKIHHQASGQTPCCREPQALKLYLPATLQGGAWGSGRSGARDTC